MNQTKVQFRPVYGSEATILGLQQQPGYLYFATDTGTIYLDTETENKKLMSSVGSGVGVTLYYGKDADPIQIQDSTNDTLFSLNLYLIDSYESLKEDDLILNTDGCFYKVLSVDVELGTVRTTRLSVSGSGGGDGPSNVNDLRLTWDTKTINMGSTYIYGAKTEADFTPTSDTDSKVNMVFETIDSNGEIYKTVNVPNWNSGEKYSFDTSNLPLGKNSTLKITISAPNSMMPGQKREYYISNLSTFEMAIKRVENDSLLPLVLPDTSGQLTTLSYIPVGDASSGIDLYIHVYVDGEEDPNNYKKILTSNYNRVVGVTVGKQSHGVHSITMKISAEVNGEEIYTDPIEYEGAWVEAGNNAPIVLIGSYDPVVVNYENSYIKYAVYDPVSQASGIPATVQIYKGANFISEMSITYNAKEWAVLDISSIYDVGDNTFSITCRSATKTVSVFVTEEGSRDLGLTQQDSLALNYTAAGRSNLEIKSARGVWKAQKADDNYSDEAILTGFNWQNNGWRNDGMDANGIDNGAYLAIANGSSVSIPGPTAGISLNRDKSYTIEARFRVRNVQKYSTLIQTLPTYFYVNEYGQKSNRGELASVIESTDGWDYYYDEWGNKVTDDEHSQKVHQTTDGVICKWMNGQEVGFCLGSQEAYFRTSEGIVNVRYKEDEIINISFVISMEDNMLYIYLNGILSGANKLPSGYFSIDSNFDFNSDYCDVDLYRFRIYKMGLSMPEVIHNYLSDIHNIKMYDQNQLTDALTPTLLSYENLVEYNKNNPDDLTMPYAVWKILDSGRAEKLPYYKGDECKAEVTFVNPVLDRALETGEIDEWYYYTHAPSFTASNVDINVQGTSSQGYPRRNYKTKYKSAKETWVYTKGSLAGKPLTEKHKVKDKNGVEHTLSKKYHMDNEELGTNKFTWKIDYMESSGSYNTGFANMMGNKKQPLYTKHPLEDYKLGIDTSAYRTTVYGFPVLTFHQYEDPANNPSNRNSSYTYEYIGRYNMNLDKGSNEYFGFEIEEEQIHITNEDGTHPLIADIAECWELSDNQGTWCSWRYPNDTARQAGFGATQAGTTDKLEVMQHFEYRYSPYEDYLDAIGADGKYDGTPPGDDPELAEKIIKTIGGEDANTWSDVTNAEKSAYARDKYKNLEKLFNWLDFTDQTAASGNPLSGGSVELTTTKDYTSAYIYTAVPAEATYDSNTIYYIFSDDPDTDGTEYTEFQKINFGNDANGNPQLETEESFLERFEMYRDDGEIFTREIDPSADTVSIPSGIGSYKTTFTVDNASYRIEKFRSEFTKHLDIEYCLVYFIMTELLLCYDSRGKNMMMASFGPKEAGGEYIWYPIFYDVDTQLGINNSGAALWDYDADVTEEKLFSTATSVLWNNLYSAFEDEIKAKYRVLRGTDDTSIVNGKLTYDAITGAYACSPDVFDSYAMRGIRPVIAIGLDEYYKYFAPATYVGYFTTNGELKIQTEPAYAYACQGDKKLTTELLLRNRLNYIDSWFQGGDYYYSKVKQGQLMLRVSGNNQNTSDKFLDKDSLSAQETALGYSLAAYPVEYYDARPGFKLKPFLKQYVTYFNDEIPSVPVKFEDNELQTDGVWTSADDNIVDGFKTQPNTPYQQLNYIPGVDYLSSLGDLSLSYINEFELSVGKRLLDITLGSDAPGYYNDQISDDDKFNLNAAAKTLQGDPNPGAKALLKKVLFNNLRSLNRSIDISGSEKLQEFRALNTQIPNVKFAEGAPLHTVHLPRTIQEVHLIESKNLTSILSTTPVVMEAQGDGTVITHEPETYRGLYIENLTDYTPDMKDKGHQISKFEIQGGGLGYGSYVMLRNLYDLKKDAKTNEKVDIGLTDVNWTPYVLVEVGEVPSTSTNYYLLTDHNTYVPYTPRPDSTAGIEEFNNHTLNERLYTYDDTQDISIITSLDLFDKLIAQYEIATGSSQFANLSGAGYPTVPTITGNVFIANADGEAIDENELTAKFKVHYPSLNITAQKITEANITKYVQVLDNGKEQTIEILRTNQNHPSAPTEQIPTKANYDFYGWTKTKGSDELFIEYDWINKEYKNMDSALSGYTFSSPGEILTLYAVFKIHSYKNTFIDWDGSTIEDVYIPFGEKLHGPVKIPARIDNSLELTQRYGFKGYTAQQGQNKVIKLSDYVSTQDRTFYAYYELESVYDSLVDNNYLVFTERTYISLLTQASIVGYTVGANTDYALSGKITLPTSYNGKPVIGLSNRAFSKNEGKNNDSITHIFWDKAGASGNIFIFEEYALGFETADNTFRRNNSTLVYVEMPDTIQHYGANCFKGQYNLQVSALPLDLIEISDFAFQDCENLKLDNISSKVTTIGRQAFSGAMGKKPTLTIGDTVQTIGVNAFAYYAVGGALNSEGPWTAVYIGSGIQTIGTDTFVSIGQGVAEYDTIKTIEIKKAPGSVSGEPWGATFANVSWIG